MPNQRKYDESIALNLKRIFFFEFNNKYPSYQERKTMCVGVVPAPSPNPPTTYGIKRGTFMERPRKREEASSRVGEERTTLSLGIRHLFYPLHESRNYEKKYERAFLYILSVRSIMRSFNRR